MDLLTVIIIFAVLCILIVFYLIKLGYYKLNVEVDVNRQCVFYWYKGEIIESFKFSLNTDIDSLKEKKEKHLISAQDKVEKIKRLKSQL